MPWIDAERWGPVNWQAHLQASLSLLFPTRSSSPPSSSPLPSSHAAPSHPSSAVFLLTGYGVGQALTSDIRHETAAALLDPFAIRTFDLATKYWTVADKNIATIGYGDHLASVEPPDLDQRRRMIFAFAYYRFRFEERASKKKAETGRAERAVLSTPLAPATLHESFGFRCSILPNSVAPSKSNSSASLNPLPSSSSPLLRCSIASLVSLSAIPKAMATRSFPVTYRLIEVIQGSLYMFLLGMITFYAGVLVWKERDSGMDEIHDALPNRNWPIYAAKLVALLFSVFLIVCVAGFPG